MVAEVSCRKESDPTTSTVLPRGCYRYRGAATDRLPNRGAAGLYKHSQLEAWELWIKINSLYCNYHT